MKLKHIIWGVTIGYMALIFYISSIPDLGQPAPLQQYQDAPILEHFIEFAILGILLSLSMRKLNYRHALLIALLAGVLYGISDEIHQMFVPGRQATYLDVFVDSLGVFCGVLIFGIVRDIKE